MGIVPTTRMLAEKPIKDPDTADIWTDYRCPDSAVRSGIGSPVHPVPGSRSGWHRSHRGILLPVLSHRSLHGSQDERTAPDRAEQHLQEFLHRYPSRRYRRLPADDIFCMRQVPHGCR